MGRTQELTDDQWKRIQRLLPKPTNNPKGGRPRADDRACFEGILWVLRTGARWRDLPTEYPSPSTCWRRLRDWEEADVWESVWRAFLKDLDAEGVLKWEECFIDATFAAAKKGANTSASPERAKVPKSSWFAMARAFHSASSQRLRTLANQLSPEERSKLYASLAELAVEREERFHGS